MLGAFATLVLPTFVSLVCPPSLTPPTAGFSYAFHRRSAACDGRGGVPLPGEASGQRGDPRSLSPFPWKKRAGGDGRPVVGGAARSSGERWIRPESSRRRPVAQNTEACRAGPACSVLAEAFGWPEERARRLIKLGAFYRQRGDLSDKARRVTDPDAEVTPGDHLRVHPEPKMFPAFHAVDWGARVVHESEDVLLVNKPPGVPCHATVDNAVENLLAGLRRARPEFEPLLPHRLDTDTAGLTIVAKHHEALSAMNEVIRRPAEAQAMAHERSPFDRGAAAGEHGDLGGNLVGDLVGDVDGDAVGDGPGGGSPPPGSSSGGRGGGGGSTTAEAGSLRKRYRALVEVLPGYPPLRTGPLLHFTRKTNWAPKDFRREAARGCRSGVPFASAGGADGTPAVPNVPEAGETGGCGLEEDIRDGATGETWQACRLIVLSARAAIPRAVSESVPGARGGGGGGATSLLSSEMGVACDRATNGHTVLPSVVPGDGVLYDDRGVGGAHGVGGADGGGEGRGGGQVPGAGARAESSAGGDKCLDNPVRVFQEVEVELVTGRSHQIRGQLAAEGCPIVGDRLYRHLQDGPARLPRPSGSGGGVENPAAEGFDESAGVYEGAPGIGAGPGARGDEQRRERGFIGRGTGDRPAGIDGGSGTMPRPVAGTASTTAGAEGSRREEKGANALLDGDHDDQGSGRDGNDAHWATRTPGNYVDSPYLALQACELRLEIGGRVHEAQLPPESCWWHGGR